MDPIRVIINNWPGDTWIQTWVPLVISIVALVISSIPYWPKRSKIEGKIISLVASPSQDYTYIDLNLVSKTICGFGYNLQTSFTVLRKDLVIKDFQIYVKYLDDNKKYTAHVFRANDYKQNLVSGKKIILDLPINQELLYINYLEEGRANAFYTSFIIERKKSNDPKLVLNFEEIEYVFRDYKDRLYSIKFYRKDIDPKKILYDKKIWKDE